MSAGPSPQPQPPPGLAPHQTQRIKFALKSVAFRTEREKSWKALESVVDDAERTGVQELPANDLGRLPTLYRAALSSLSVARAISLDRNVLQYLEALAARAFFVVYSPRRNPIDGLKWFFTRGFPQAVRAHALEVGAAAAIFFLGALAAFALTLSDMDRYASFIDPAMSGGRDPGASTEYLRGTLYGGGRTESVEGLSVFAAFLFTHNTRIAILCFALGFAAGVPVFFLLFTNGLVLGAFAALFHSRGLSGELFGWLLPHGIPEIFAIILCGGAGLALGRALVFPGRHGRLGELALRGRAVAPIVAGAGALLLVAGLIEGVFRQLVHSTGVRYLVAITNAVGLASYLLLAGRDDAAATPAPERPAP